jgi:hypothetical protein
MGTRAIKWDLSPGINAIEALRAFGRLTPQMRFFFQSADENRALQSFCQGIRYSYGG